MGVYLFIHVTQALTEVSFDDSILPLKFHQALRNVSYLLICYGDKKKVKNLIAPKPTELAPSLYLDQQLCLLLAH